MSPPPTGLDMDYDPEEDDAEENESESVSSHSGPKMMWAGLVIMGVFILWDYFTSPPSKLTYGILGLWLMLSTFVAISEGIYR